MASNEETSTEHKHTRYSASTADEKKTSDNNQKKETGFECNICLDTARDAVLSLCGHLFCWPCIHRWLETPPCHCTCPVCKGALSREKLVPIYGRNSPRTDPRDTIPPRPAGTRHEPDETRTFAFGEGIHFQMSLGLGAFPFGFFHTNNPESHQTAPSAGAAAQYEHELLSHVLLGIALAVILFIIFD